MALWSCIREFQTLIVGVIGFAGVIVTLVLNARYAREQRRDERRHQRQTLRVALIEELKINREALVRGADKLRDTGNDILMPADVGDDAYRAFTDRIGALSQEEVGKVMYAYLGLRDFNAKLFLIGIPRHNGDRYVLVPAKNVPRLSAMQEGGVGPIDEAIGVLERCRDVG